MKNQIARLDNDQKQIVSPHEVEDLVQKWLKDLRRTRAPDTVSAYPDAVEGYYLKWLGRNSLDLFGVGPSNVEDWLDEMAKTVTKGTVAIRYLWREKFMSLLV